MTAKNQIPPQERHLRSTLLRQLSTAPLLPGRLYTVARTCGKPTCRCNRGHKHVSLYLRVYEQGKVKSIAIPKDMEADARQAVENYQQARDQLQAIANAQLARLLDEKQARKRARAVASR